MSNTATGSKSVDQYLIQAAIALCPIEAAQNIDSLRVWMVDNMDAIIERASGMQSDLMNRFFASDAVQAAAKKHIGERVFHAAQK